MEFRKPTFAAIVRTKGDRPCQLREALISLTFQCPPCKAIVVVHADAARHGQVVQCCSEVEGLDFVVLHAGETWRQRGYPLNVALRYCYQSSSEVDYLCFLDDDDIVYPFFTRVLADAFLTSGADLVFAAANRRCGDLPAESGYVLRPAAWIVYQNFIPINSFAVKLKVLRVANVYFDEGCEILEDWRFLLALLERGCRFEAHSATLSEFRSSDDPVRKYGLPLCIQHWLKIREYVNTSSFQIPGPTLLELVKAELPYKVEVDDGEVAVLEKRVFDLEHSWSWRVTWPLRKLGRMAHQWFP